MLSEQGGIEILGEAASGEEGIQLARELAPSVVLLDIQMPGMGGLEATRRLSRLQPPPKIIALTSHEGIHLASHLLRMGVSGYVTKHTDIDELIKAIRAVHVGEKYVTLEIAQKLALNDSKDITKSPLEALSEREIEVLWMVARGQTVHTIAKQLFLSTKTVNTYRYRLFEKLGVCNDVELTHLAYHLGLLEQKISV
jgi:two-component system invasion response regulator UvrY